MQAGTWCSASPLRSGQDRIGLAAGLTAARLTLVDTSDGLAIRIGNTTLGVLPGVIAGGLKTGDFVTS